MSFLLIPITFIYLFVFILFHSILFYSIKFYSIVFCLILFYSILFYSIFFHTANERTKHFAWSIMISFDIVQVLGSHQNVFTLKLIEGQWENGRRNGQEERRKGSKRMKGWKEVRKRKKEMKWMEGCKKGRRGGKGDVNERMKERKVR